MHVSTCSQNSSMIIMTELWQLWRPWGGNQYATVGVEGILHAVLQRVLLALSKALSKSIPCIQCIPCADKVESKWSQTFLQILLICSLIRLKRLWRTATTWRNVTHEEMWRNVTCEGMWRVRLFFFYSTHGAQTESESAERLFAYVSQWHARPCSWDLRCVQQRRPQRRGTPLWRIPGDPGTIGHRCLGIPATSPGSMARICGLLPLPTTPMTFIL